MEKCVEQFGALHVLVNSAGILIPTMMITSKASLNIKALRKTIEVNLYGTLYFCKYATVQMAKQEIA